MKTNKWFLALTCVGALLVNNVLSAVDGKVTTNYQSNAEYRGQSIGDDAIGAAVNAETKLNDLSVGLSLSTLNSLDNDASLHLLDVGVSTDVMADKLAVSLGWLGTDNGDYENEVYVSAGLNVMFSPSLTVYKNTSHDLYTYVFGVSTNEIKVDGLPVTFVAGVDVGSVDRTTTDSETYVEAHVCAKHTVSDSADVYAGVEYDNSDLVDDEVGFVVGLNVSF